MSGLDFELDIFAILHFNGFLNDVQLFPFTVDIVFQTLFIKLFLPQVARVRARSRLTKADLLSFADSNQRNSRHCGTSQAILAPNQLV